jgi:DNA-directed RNA polymerase subunit RPC12/RpoP
MKYKKKPVIIDAVQWTGNNHREIFDFLTENAFDKESMKVTGDNFYIDHSKVEGGLIIKTLEGEHLATIGDYIIRGVQGEYYPCKEDIFLQTYEKVEDINISKGNSILGNGYITNPCGTSDKVPYYTICNCNPINGGSGICGCTIGNTMVNNPKHNINLNTTTTSTAFYPNNNPQPNGIKCPKCGEELMDTYPNMILTSDPAQKNVHCPKCDHKGYRFV